MKTLNPNTKKAKAFIEAFLKNPYHELYHVYDKYSTNKIIAMMKARQKCYYEHGYELRIISWNTFHFTCAWRIKNKLRVETKNNSYIIPNALPF